MHLRGIALILMVDITTVVFIRGSNARQHDTVSAGPATENPALKGRRLGRWRETEDLSRSLWHHGKEQESREDG